MKKILSTLKPTRHFFSSKYREIIAAVGLFILLDAGVLILNYYTSYQISNDAHAIKLASGLGTMSQSIFHQLFQVRENLLRQGEDFEKSTDILAKSYKIFDETLDSFIYGGALIGEGQGQDALLEDATYKKNNAHILRQAETLWKDYRIKLKPVVYSYFNDLDREELIEESNDSILYASANNEKLLGLLSEFAKAVEEVAHRKAERLRKIQALGITLAIINFFLILFHFLRKLSENDAAVERARKETQDILKTVDEGLFLLNKECVIGSQSSASLRSLFARDSFENQNFVELLRPLVTEKTLEVVVNYLDILFKPSVNEELIVSLNPLDQVEINLSSNLTEMQTRYFTFQFTRIYEKGCLQNLLVTVKDITRQIMLEKELKEAKMSASKDMELLLSMMHVEGDLLDDFLRSADNSLDYINNILKNPIRSEQEYKEKLLEIARVTHRIKGDSSGLRINFIEEKIERFEESVVRLKNGRNISGESFLPLVVQLNKLMDDFSVMNSLVEKLKQLQGLEKSKAQAAGNTIVRLQDHQAVGGEMNRWKKHFSGVVSQIAEHYGKQARLLMSGFDTVGLSVDMKEAVKDIVIQCLRNAVAHGIEKPEVRMQAGKNSVGTVKVTLLKDMGGIELMVKDDGCGIDLEPIRDKAVELGLLDRQKAGECAPNKLISLLFKQGFSTAKNADYHAGQGVGLDVIKSRLEQMNGKVKVRYSRGQYTLFHFRFETDLKLVRTA